MSVDDFEDFAERVNDKIRKAISEAQIMRKWRPDTREAAELSDLELALQYAAIEAVHLEMLLSSGEAEPQDVSDLVELYARRAGEQRAGKR